MFTKIKNFFGQFIKTDEKIIQELVAQYMQGIKTQLSYGDNKVLVLTSAELSHLKLALKSYLKDTQDSTKLYKTNAKEMKQFAAVFTTTGRHEQAKTYEAHSKLGYKKAAKFSRANTRVSEIQRKIKQAA